MTPRHSVKHLQTYLPHRNVVAAEKEDVNFTRHVSRLFLEDVVVEEMFNGRDNSQ